MASTPDKQFTSSDIAEHASTNPVVVRRVLGKLRKAGLMHSEKGHGGGWTLAKDATQITLADIYIALDEKLIATDQNISTSNCSVERVMHKNVALVLDDAEKNLIKHFSTFTVDQLKNEAL